MRCGDKIEEEVQQQSIRLCQENPDGTEDCAGDEKAGMAYELKIEKPHASTRSAATYLYNVLDLTAIALAR